MKYIYMILILIPSTVCIGSSGADFNNDGIVNFTDFATFADQWLQQSDGGIISYPHYGVKELGRGKYLPVDFLESCEVYDDPQWATWFIGDCIKTEELNLVRCGQKSIRMTHTAADTYSLLMLDLGSESKKNFLYHNFRVRYYIDPLTETTVMNLYFNNGEYDRPNRGLINLPYAAGWNTVEFTWGAVAPLGNFDPTSPVQTITFVYDNPAINSFYVLDMIEAWPTNATKGSVIFTFDDGKLTEYEEGIRYLAKYGFRSMFYISSEAVDGQWPGHCNWDQIKAAADCGALICTHRQSSIVADLGEDCTDDDLRQWCAKQKEYLVKRGYVTGADYFAIPGGQTSGAVRGPEDMPILREYFCNIRGTQPWWQDCPDGWKGNVSLMPRYPREVWWSHSFNQMASVATGKAAVDKAVVYKDLLVFMIHEIGIDGSIPVATFRSVVDYVKTKVDAGELEVITFEEVVRGLD